jgi:hypothetical protein
VNAIWIWIGALVLYGLFTAWYHSWRPPLRPDEIDGYMSRFEALSREPGGPAAEQLPALRRFMEADDGGEFFMVNLIRLEPAPVVVPGSDEKRPAAQVLRRYTGYFMPALLRRAGHPAFFARAAGGTLESWGVASDPGWSLAGVIRYRSRRDLLELASDPAFGPAHVFKIAAIAGTFAFPAAPGLVVVGPRVWVGLALGLLAALAHLLVLALRTRS